MDDAVHGAASMLDRLLERVHGAGDVLLEGVGDENVIFLGIAVIGARPGEIVDPVVRVVLAAGAMGSIFARRTRERVPGAAAAGAC